MVWLPTDNEVVLKEAVVTPAVVLTLTGLPALLPSTWNWTVPLGVPAPGAVMLIVTVKITFWPATGGASDETTAVLVLAFVTLWVRAVDVLAEKLLSPP